jgi:3-hydroxybutyryl-CoA dehydrogenase
MDMKISKAVVIGSGVMGHGICQILAQHGINVSLVDTDDKILERAKGWISDNLAYMVQIGQLDGGRIEEILTNITFTTDLAGSLDGARYVLEAASENFEIKRKIWAVLSSHAPQEAILASNTSSYDINELAEGISGPERIIGTHWFHPPPITPCVEVIPCNGADQANIDWTMKFLTWLGKAPTLCKSAPGFVANRIQMAMAKEAIALVEEGLATPAEVDRVVKTSIGFRLGAFGPFEIIDQAGTDVYCSVYEYLDSKLPGEKFKPPGLLQELVEAGRFGLKSSGGFYTYGAGAADETRRKRDRLLYTRLNQFKEEQESEK